MKEKIEIMDILQNKQILENELKKLSYGSIEIRENDSNKYIYVHYREEGVSLTKYVGEYSEELYNLVLNIMKNDREDIEELFNAEQKKAIKNLIKI